MPFSKEREFLHNITFAPHDGFRHVINGKRLYTVYQTTEYTAGQTFRTLTFSASNGITYTKYQALHTKAHTVTFYDSLHNINYRKSKNRKWIIEPDYQQHPLICHDEEDLLDQLEKESTKQLLQEEDVDIQSGKLRYKQQEMPFNNITNAIDRDNHIPDVAEPSLLKILFISSLFPAMMPHCQYIFSNYFADLDLTPLSNFLGRIKKHSFSTTLFIPCLFLFPSKTTASTTDPNQVSGPPPHSLKKRRSESSSELSATNPPPQLHSAPYPVTITGMRPPTGPLIERPFTSLVEYHPHDYFKVRFFGSRPAVNLGDDDIRQGDHTSPYALPQRIVSKILVNLHITEANIGQTPLRVVHAFSEILIPMMVFYIDEPATVRGKERLHRIQAKVEALIGDLIEHLEEFCEKYRTLLLLDSPALQHVTSATDPVSFNSKRREIEHMIAIACIDYVTLTNHIPLMSVPSGSVKPEKGEGPRVSKALNQLDILEAKWQITQWKMLSGHYPIHAIIVVIRTIQSTATQKSLQTPIHYQGSHIPINDLLNEWLNALRQAPHNIPSILGGLDQCTDALFKTSSSTLNDLPTVAAQSMLDLFWYPPFSEAPYFSSDFNAASGDTTLARELTLHKAIARHLFLCFKHNPELNNDQINWMIREEFVTLVVKRLNDYSLRWQLDEDDMQEFIEKTYRFTYIDYRNLQNHPPFLKNMIALLKKLEEEDGKHTPQPEHPCLYALSQ